jgi:hypothetical protein
MACSPVETFHGNLSTTDLPQFALMRARNALTLTLSHRERVRVRASSPNP